MSETRLLVVSRGARNMNDQVEAKLRKAFSDYLTLDFDPEEDYSKLVSPRARIVVAGGDGTVEFMIRKFADTNHPIGVIPMGTFNNLARALGLPTEVDEAIEVVRTGRTHAITLGRVNGRIFIEACAVGLFGEAIVLGEDAKDMEFGKLASRLRELIAARPFRYELEGDIKGSGAAMSLVFSNTASIGSQIPISESTPMNPWLEFSVHVGRTRSDIVGRALKSALLQKHDEETAQVFRFTRLEVTTRPRVRVYADNMLVGRTPATITAETSSLKMVLPKQRAKT